MSGSGIQHAFASTTAIDERLRRRYHSPLSSPGEPQGVHDIRTDAYAPWISAGSSLDPSPVSSQGSVSSNTSSTSPPRYRYATQEVKLEVLVQVMDSSLRRMMSDYKPARPGGVVLSSDAGCPKLAAISPALFSPGYAKAFSQRTGLLPTTARALSRVYRRTDSSGSRHKLRQLQELPLSSYLGRGSTEDFDPHGATFSSSVKARLWFLTQSKLIDPVACRGFKSLSTSSIPALRSHEMLDELLDDAGGEMLDGKEALTFNAIGDAMELDEAKRLDIFREYSLDGTADEGEELLDDDHLWGRAQYEVTHDGVETLDRKCCGTYAFESGDDMLC